MSAFRYRKTTFGSVTPLTEARLGLRGTYYEEGGHLSLNPRFSLSRVLQEGWRDEVVMHQALTCQSWPGAAIDNTYSSCRRRALVAETCGFHSTRR